MIPAVWRNGLSGWVVVVIAARLLSGCGSLGLGSDHFGCAGVPEGVHCLSARQVYQATEGTDTVKSPPTESTAAPVPPPASDTVRGGDGPRTEWPMPTMAPPAVTAVPAVIPVAATRSGLPQTASTPAPRLDGPVPIRTPAQVMRIWFGPWEDQGGNLHLTGYVYTEIEPRRWVVGTVAEAVSPSLFATRPLRPLGVCPTYPA
ncbi:MAG: type IV conjugative transfer system lipoprotein TraV [Candidatus Competibacteraceae bacterium]